MNFHKNSFQQKIENFPYVLSIGIYDIKSDVPMSPSSEATNLFITSGEIFCLLLVFGVVGWWWWLVVPFFSPPFSFLF
jgi:hypothetical protein